MATVTSSSSTNASIYNGTPTYTYGSTYVNHTSDAGGAFASVRGYIGAPGTYPAVEVAVQGMAGTGYGPLRFVRSLRTQPFVRTRRWSRSATTTGCFSLESHWSPKFDVFAYYGGEYAQRTVYTVYHRQLRQHGRDDQPDRLRDSLEQQRRLLQPADATAARPVRLVRSRPADPAQAPTKYIQEGMIGFQWRPITSPKYGRLQYSVTYSIVNRQLWAGLQQRPDPRRTLRALRTA